MKIAVITEYNPFHKGHEYQIKELRRHFEDATVIAVMGGIFSQRGEPYISTPYIRGEAAVASGVDLCLELPFPFSAARAAEFARAGVEIAAKAGADVLAFGSECGELDLLFKVADRLESSEIKAAAEKVLCANEAIGKTRAYSLAYKELYGEDCPTMPNDILALEYIKAIKNGGFSLTPFTIKRVGDFKSGKGGFASATSIRSSLKKGFSAVKGDIPPSACEIFENAYKNLLFGSDIERISAAVLMTLAKDKGSAAHGLASRIYKEAQNSKSISELKAGAATKRYTDAEISRQLLYAFLDVSEEDILSPVCYTRLLATNEKGRVALKGIKDICVLTKPSAYEKMPARAKAMFEKSFLAERAFALCLEGDYDFLRESPRVK